MGIAQCKTCDWGRRLKRRTPANVQSPKRSIVDSSFFLPLATPRGNIIPDSSSSSSATPVADGPMILDRSASPGGGGGFAIDLFTLRLDREPVEPGPKPEPGVFRLGGGNMPNSAELVVSVFTHAILLNPLNPQNTD